mmetsp:Transcript_25537/g.54165  ORF Transcript_25537/g.54165 Transcript_25537/m.54165 type:complete len:213 (+) Transcript_25537:263-901(+)
MLPEPDFVSSCHTVGDPDQQEANSPNRFDETVRTEPNQVVDVVRQRKRREASPRAPEEEVSTESGEDRASNVHRANNGRNITPSHSTALRNLRRAVVQPLQFQELLPGPCEFLLVPVVLVLDRTSYSCPEDRGDSCSQEQHQISSSCPHLTLCALQVKTACQSHRDDRQSYRQSSYQTLRQRQLQDPCEHRRGPIWASAENHILAPRQARLG